MGDRIRTAKIFVQASANGVKTLRYLNSNITAINKQGMVIKIEKLSEDELDEDTVEMFKRRGITRLPALITPDNVVFSGVDEITGQFERRMNKLRMANRIGGGDCLVDDYLHQEIHRGVKKKADGKGRKVFDVEKEEDDEVGERAEMMDRIANAQRKRKPAGGDDDDFDPDEAAANLRAGTPREPQREDNVEFGGIDIPGDDMDSQMLRVLMQNTPAGDY